MNLASIKTEFQSFAKLALLQTDPTTVEQWLSEAISLHFDRTFSRQMSDPPLGTRRLTSKKAIIADDGEVCDVEYEICDNAVGLAWSTEEHIDGVHHYEVTVCSLASPVWVGLVQGDGTYKAHHSLEAQGAALRLRRGEAVSAASFLTQGECGPVTPTPMETTTCTVGVMLNLNQREVIFFVNRTEVWRLCDVKVADGFGTRFALSNSGYGGKFQVTYKNLTTKPTNGYGMPVPFVARKSVDYATEFRLLKQQNCRGIVTESEVGEPSSVLVEFENYANSVGVMVDPSPMIASARYTVTVKTTSSELWFGLLETTMEHVVSRTACEVKPLYDITLAVSSKGRVMCPAHKNSIFTTLVDNVTVEPTAGIDLVVDWAGGKVSVAGVVVATLANTASSTHFACSNDGTGVTATIARN